MPGTAPAGSRRQSGAAPAGAGQCDEAAGHAGPADDGPDALAIHEGSGGDEAEALDQPDPADEDEDHADNPQKEHGLSLAVGPPPASRNGSTVELLCTKKHEYDGYSYKEHSGVARGKLLHGPGVAVRIAEVDERAPGLHVHLTHVHAAPGELRPGFPDVGDHELQAL